MKRPITSALTNREWESRVFSATPGASGMSGARLGSRLGLGSRIDDSTLSNRYGVLWCAEGERENDLSNLRRVSPSRPKNGN